MNKTYSIRQLLSVKNLYLASNGRNASTEKIKIPLYIKRGPTDVLRAIASTVQVDTTGPAYQFHDDPFLTPQSRSDKRRFSLAKEAGRKAAKWIRDSHGDLFNFQADDPIIKDFLPKVNYEENDINEVTLLEAINNVQVTDAMEMYRICKDNNKDLSQETLQSLLELLCYFNSEETTSEDWIEERMSKDVFVVNRMNRLIKSWKDQGVAEEIFENLKENGSKPYCAIIRGMCNYYQNEQALQLFKEAKEQNIVLDTETYNCLIRLSVMEGDESAMKWKFIQDLLTTMVEKQVKPNLRTLNAVLESLSHMESWRNSSGLSLQVLKEFEMIGVEPSLASYYYIIKIHRSDRFSTSPVLPSIMHRIEGKAFKLQDVNDTWFFCRAMESCNDFHLASRLYNTLLVEDNYLLLGENLKEIIFYKHYLLQALRDLPFEEYLRLYERMVPFIYAPDTAVFEEMVKLCGILDNVSEIPRMWSDMISLNSVFEERLLELVLMVTNRHKLESADDTLSSRLSVVAFDLYTRVEEFRNNPRTRKTLDWTGYMLGDCVSILSRCGNNDKAISILSNLLKNPCMSIGPIPIEALQYLFNAALEAQNEEHCFEVVKYAKENEFPETESLAGLMASSLKLSEEMKHNLTYNFGQVTF